MRKLLAWLQICSSVFLFGFGFLALYQIFINGVEDRHGWLGFSSFWGLSIGFMLCCSGVLLLYSKKAGMIAGVIASIGISLVVLTTVEL